MSSKVTKLTLADKINNLITAAPTNFGSDDDDDQTKARVVDKYDETSSDDDVGLSSSLRKDNISLLEDTDERYKGKKVSRKDVYGSDESDYLQSDVDSGNSEGIDSDHENVENESEEGSEDDQSNSEEDQSDDSNNSLETDQSNDVNLKDVIPSNEGEVEKGECVRHQLKIWENLLEMRIKLQKCLITSNKLPQYDVHEQFMSEKQCLKQKIETTNNLKKLLDNMLLIQNKLLNNYPETKTLVSNKNINDKSNEVNNDDDDDSMNEEIDSDTDNEEEKKAVEKDEAEVENPDEPPKKKQKTKKTLVEYEKILYENHKKYVPYRNSVIQKWNDKTRIASGKMNKGSSQSVVKQIEFILNDKFKIIQKTQLKRSEYEIIGKKSTNDSDEDGRRLQEYDKEIYDDDDFYHQLLRELIEQKSADITDPIQLSKQWIQLQSMRSKIKRKIDTRATKGRRIRYNVHPKLVNFMAPITVNDTWSDEAKTELFNSLFGKIKVV